MDIKSFIWDDYYIILIDNIEKLNNYFNYTKYDSKYYMIKLTYDEIFKLYEDNKKLKNESLTKIFDVLIKNFTVVNKKCKEICCANCGNTWDGNAQCTCSGSSDNYMGYCKTCDKYTNFYC